MIETKFGIFRQDCFDNITTQYRDTAFVASCMKFTILKTLSLMIIGGSFLFKVPQIIKIVKAKSTENISAFRYYVSTLVPVHSATYNMHLDMPILLYGDNIVVTI